MGERERDYTRRDVARREPSPSGASESSEAVEKERPNYECTGVLKTDEALTVKGRVMKWVEPHDMKASERKWVFYVLREGKPMESADASVDIKAAASMFGRDAGVCQLPLNHPSISSQHAVLVFRAIATQEGTSQIVKPFIIDLGSTNGTFLNGKRLKADLYMELRPKDMLQFGLSAREYILLDATDVRTDA